MSSRVDSLLRPRQEACRLEVPIAFFMANVEPLTHARKYISVAATTPIALTRMTVLARNGISDLRS